MDNLSQIEDCISRIILDAGPLVTDVDPAEIRQNYHVIADIDAARLGIKLTGPKAPLILVSDKNSSIGSVAIDCHGDDCVFLFDNKNGPKRLQGTIKILGKNSYCLFFGMEGLIKLSYVFLRAHHQVLFWGRGATSVGASIELDGISSKLYVGDDGMLSSGIWIRNCDMHTIFDTNTNLRINAAAKSLKIEQHVWLAQDSLVLGAENIGYGSIIGAKSVARNSTAPKTLNVGTPAKTIKENTSWDRASNNVSKATVDLLHRLDALQAKDAP